jgi:hypothetical protein
MEERTCTLPEEAIDWVRECRGEPDLSLGAPFCSEKRNSGKNNCSLDSRDYNAQFAQVEVSGLLF